MTEELIRALSVLQLGYQASWGNITRDELMTELLRRTYTDGNTCGPCGDGFVRGTWDDVQFLYYAKLITKEERDKINSECVVLTPPPEAS